MGRDSSYPAHSPLSGPLPDPFADSAPPRYQFQQGAYMQDSLQIQALLERYRALELREVQLSMERDTIKAMFERLVSSIRSDLLQSDSTIIGPSSADSTRPTRQLYPGISFWTQDNYMEWLETASSRTADRGKLPYLEDADGAPVPETTIKAISKLLRGGWSELLSRKMAPQSWGKVSASGRQLVHSLMEGTFPLFKFADNGWKLDYLATSSYPSWRRNNLDSDNNHKSRDSIKKEEEEANDDNDDDDTTDEQTSKKCRHPTMSPVESKVPSKKTKVDSFAQLAPPSAPPSPTHTPSVSTASLPALDTPVVSTKMPSVELESVTDPEITPSVSDLGPVNTDNAVSIADTSTVHKPVRVTLPNPLSVHSLAAANVDIPPSPQVTPDHPLETPGPIDPLLDDSTSLIIKKEKMSKAGSKCKMRPSPTKNGRNLCAHRWLKQMNTTGSMDEFCIYYNSLSQGQHKEYDDEASKLIAEGNWNKTTIVAGKIY
ncbi:hypothetical protein EV702DRAFT_1042653 [Suillus placidus]|uniref:Uncharacterized protein n=1 Tax=Suillus placidus TaxID=48579 RepID=A0A9P7A251_9AGAM|nr:hypothetical protein EV702DRAFT_1042653 [Suillus placidus]